MVYIRQENGKTIGYASIAPPSAEAELWFEVADDDPRVVDYLNPSPPPVRDWATFQAVGTIASLPVIGFNSQTAAISSVFVVLMGQVGANEAVLPNIIYLWNAMVAIAHPDAETTGTLRQLAAACNLPFTLDESGMMVLVG